MFNRYARTQRRSRRNWRDIVLTLLPFLPVILLFATLDILAPFGSSGQKTLEVAAYAMVTVIVPSMEAWHFYRKFVRAQIMLSLIFLSYYLTSLEAINHDTTWMLIVAPAAFIVIVCLLTRRPFETFMQRLVICSAVFLFLANIYLADILHLWWLSLIISLIVGSGVWLFLRVFSMYPRHLRSIIGRVTLLVTVVMVLISLFLGLTASSHTITGVGANFVACVLAGFSARLLTLKRNIQVWCFLTLLILISTSFFVIRNSESLIVFALAGLGVVGAAVASWHMPILPLPVPARPYPYNPRFEEDYFDGEDDSEDEDMLVLNEGEEVENGEDGFDS